MYYYLLKIDSVIKRSRLIESLSRIILVGRQIILDESFSLFVILYDTIIHVCRALANCHITQQALRDNNNAFFQQQRRRVCGRDITRSIIKNADGRPYPRQGQCKLEDIASQGYGGNRALEHDKIQNLADYAVDVDEEDVRLMQRRIRK